MAVRPGVQKKNPESETVWPSMLTFPCNLKRRAPCLKLRFLMCFCNEVFHLHHSLLSVQESSWVAKSCDFESQWRCWWQKLKLELEHIPTKSSRHRFMLALCYWQNTILPNHLFFSIEPMSFGHAKSNFIELHDNFSRNNTSQLILLALST